MMTCLINSNACIRLLNLLILNRLFISCWCSNN